MESDATVPDRADTDGAPRLWLGPGYAGFIGPAVVIDPHSTAVACLGVGLDAPFTFRADSIEDVTTRSAYSPARHKHQVLGCDGRMLFLFLDPTRKSTVDFTINMHHTVGPFGFDHRAEDKLIAECREKVVDFDRLLEHANVTIRQVMDFRISRVMNVIRADPASERSAADFAHELKMSTSHFLHLFGEQTNTSYRRYRQWARMLNVADGFAAGHDLTRCAVDAGFSSLSHFSQTFHSMFGMTATALINAGARLDIAPMPNMA